jgi:rhodanese-related sulfurtransferase
MGIFDFFKPVETIAPDEVHKLISEGKSEEYFLLDVRQEGEYASGHLPGAKLIPLNELAQKHRELDPEKTTVVYCRAGVRSRSAAGILKGLGFDKVFSMKGGILAYNGAMAIGGPDSGMFCFPDTLTPGQLAAVAWYLEEGTLEFIDGIKGKSEDTANILDEVRKVKVDHKSTLEGLYRELSGEEPGEDFPRGAIDTPPEAIMVGCVKVAAAVKWAEGKSATEVLELLISLEASALDLYLKLGRAVRSEDARRAFDMLAQEQQRSMDRVSAVFDRALGRA